MSTAELVLEREEAPRPEARRLGYRPELDGLRGLAVALVLGIHWFPTWVPGGAIGVDLFFVLSGFLITTLLVEEHARGQVSLRGFYGRRARRLLPASWVLLAVCAAVPGAVFAGLYVANVARAAGELGGPLEHFWSLAIEEQFYLLWPVLLLGALRLRRPWLVPVLGVAVCVAVRLDASEAVAINVARFDGLLIGCTLALLWPRLRHLDWRLPALVALPVLAYVTAAWPDLTGFGYTVVAVCWAAVLAAVMSGAAHELFTAKPMVWLGKLSYSLYLWHYPVVVWLRGDVSDTDPFTTTAAIVVGVAAAVVSYRLVELPLRARKPRRHPARRQEQMLNLAGTQRPCPRDAMPDPAIEAA